MQETESRAEPYFQSKQQTSGMKKIEKKFWKKNYPCKNMAIMNVWVLLKLFFTFEKKIITNILTFF